MTDTRVTLRACEGAVVHEDGLPRPRWDVVWRAVEAMPQPSRHDTWTRLAHEWLSLLAEAYGPPYHIAANEQFVALLALPERRARSLLATAEDFRRQALRLLPGLARDEGFGPHALLLFRSPEHYYTYVCHYHTDGDYAASGGCFIHAGYGHIVFACDDAFSLEETLAHGLSHAMLSQRELPLWLEEGLVQHLTDALTRSDRFWLDHGIRQRHHACWSGGGSAGFWTGDAFSDPDDDTQELAYHLAYWLVMYLMERDRPAFLSFAAAAGDDDAGASAARQHLDASLVDLVTEILGEGDWDAAAS